jgi:hypothetical protein
MAMYASAVVMERHTINPNDHLKHFYCYHYSSYRSVDKKNMMRLLYVAVAGLMIFLCVRVFNKYKKLALPKSYNELDSLDMMLTDVKRQLPANSIISFKTNTSPGRKGVLYFKSAFVLAPIVVQLGESDTVLLIQEHQFPAVPQDNYECILSGGNRDFNYSLVRIKE